MEWKTVGRDNDLEKLEQHVAAGQSVLVVAPAGVGKSHLMREVLERRERAGATVVRITGSPTSSSVPFGVVAHLIDDTAVADRALLMHHLRDQLVARAADSSLLIGVDDLPQLDEPTLTLIRSLINGRDAVVVATARAEDATTPSILELWKDGLAARVDLAPLGRSESDALAGAILGGRPSIRLAGRLWDIAQGNPLYTRELLLFGQSAGQIVWQGEFWDHTDDLGANPRLHDLVRSRLDVLDDAARQALNLVAVTEPIAVDRLEHSESIAELERRLLITVEQEGDTVAARCSHPLIGEVVRDRIGLLDRRQVLATAASALATDSATPSDALRIATWLLEAGEEPEPELAVLGANAALRRFDPGLAERLARSALEGERSSEALTALGRALAGQGSPGDAAVVLAEALTWATTDPEIAAAGVALAENALFGLGDPASAVQHVEQAAGRIAGDSIRASVESFALLALGLAGQFGEALERGADLVSRDLPPEAAVPSLMAYSLAQTMTGRVDQTLEIISRGESLVPAVRLQHPLARDQLGLNRVLAHQARAEFRRSLEVADTVISAPDFGDRLAGPWLYITAPTRHLTGDVDTAIALTSESVALHRANDPIGTLPMVLGLSAVALAMRGDTAAALARVDEAAADPRSAAPRCQIWLRLAEAWIAGHEGDLDRAADMAAEAGRDAIRAWHTVWGAVALHDAVRFGRADLIDRDLSEIAADAGPLVALFARHADAAARGAAIALGKVAGEFEDLGAWGAAVDARAAESAALERDDPKAAARAAVRAHDLHRRCPSYDSPLLRGRGQPLTARPLEAARLAAAGLSTKEIAQRLFVSVRTVDNHLQRSYATLGVAGREALAEVFAVDGGGKAH